MHLKCVANQTRVIQSGGCLGLAADDEVVLPTQAAAAAEVGGAALVEPRHHVDPRAAKAATTQYEQKNRSPRRTSPGWN